MTTEHALAVQRNEANHRFEATVDGSLAGFVDYRQRDGEVVLIHTETLDGFGGQGVATALAQFALDDIRARGERAVALCPFIRSYIAKHPEYAGVVAHHH